MSFGSASEFLNFSRWALSFRYGITILMVESEFGFSRRSAQRKLHELENLLPECKTEVDDTGQKRWIFRPAQLAEFATIKPEQLSALDLAEKTLLNDSAYKEAEAVRELSRMVRSLLPNHTAFRIETDSSALLEAQGILARPGPQPIIDSGTFDLIGEAIKGCTYLSFSYSSQERKLAPYGVLYGNRPYLVGHYQNKDISQMRYFRLDKMSDLSLSDEMFERDDEFNLDDYTKRSFGVFQNEAEYTDVVWKFSPQAAENADTFRFHPDQVKEWQDDGSLIVRFKASGYVEMCWYLYSWGNEVEVLEPRELRDLCAKHSDVNFSALP